MEQGFKREYKAKSEDESFDKEHGHDECHEECSFEEKAPPRPLNLILPLLFLISSTIFFLWLTGKDKGLGFLGALLNADFEKSIFISGLVTVVLTCIFYLFQKVPLRELDSHFLSGGNEMIPPIVVLILSWGLSGIIEELGFTKFVTGVAAGVPVFLIPAAIYLIGCFCVLFPGNRMGDLGIAHAYGGAACRICRDQHPACHRRGPGRRSFGRQRFTPW